MNLANPTSTRGARLDGREWTFGLQWIVRWCKETYRELVVKSRTRNHWWRNRKHPLSEALPFVTCWRDIVLSDDAFLKVADDTVLDHTPCTQGGILNRKLSRGVLLLTDTIQFASRRRVICDSHFSLGVTSRLRSLTPVGQFSVYEIAR